MACGIGVAGWCNAYDTSLSTVFLWLPFGSMDNSEVVFSLLFGDVFAACFPVATQLLSSAFYSYIYNL